MSEGEDYMARVLSPDTGEAVKQSQDAAGAIVKLLEDLSFEVPQGLLALTIAMGTWVSGQPKANAQRLLERALRHALFTSDTARAMGEASRALGEVDQALAENKARGGL